MSSFIFLKDFANNWIRGQTVDVTIAEGYDQKEFLLVDQVALIPTNELLQVGYFVWNCAYEDSELKNLYIFTKDYKQYKTGQIRPIDSTLGHYSIDGNAISYGAFRVVGHLLAGKPRFDLTEKQERFLYSKLIQSPTDFDFIFDSVVKGTLGTESLPAQRHLVEEFLQTGLSETEWKQLNLEWKAFATDLAKYRHDVIVGMIRQWLEELREKPRLMEV